MEKRLLRFTGYLLETSADKVDEKCIGATKSYGKIPATSPSLLALTVCHASRTSLRICNRFLLFHRNNTYTTLSITLFVKKIFLRTPIIYQLSNNTPHTTKVYQFHASTHRRKACDGMRD